jgi:Nucleoside-diphosphate-sugar epimerases
MTVLVTGATGFFGAHLVRVLASHGLQPIAVRRAGSDPDRLRRLAPTPDGFHQAIADLRNAGEIRALLNDTRPNAIIHAAAYGVDHRQQDLQEAVATNVTATGELVLAARLAGVRRFLHIGTCFEYGNHDGPLHEDLPLRPTSLYGSTKAAGSLLALALGGAGGPEVCVARLFGMYGPLEGAHKFVPQVLASARSGTTMACSPGGQKRDYSYVEDIADACRRLLTSDCFPAGQSINFASGRSITLRHLAETAAAAAGSTGNFLNWGAHPYRPEEVMCIEADTAKARRFLGPLPQTPLSDGMRQTLAWEAGSLV